MKLIKLSSDHYIIVDGDSEIKVWDWYYLPRTNSVYECKEDPTELNLERSYGTAKVTHSTQPIDERGYWGKVMPLTLTIPEIEELIGEVDVEEKAHNWSTRQTTRSTDYWRSMVSTYVEAYNQALEDNKEKKYTEEDILNAFTWGFMEGTERGDVLDSINKFRQYLQPKTEWEVEFVDGKLTLV